jgi:hypothetical protein
MTPSVQAQFALMTAELFELLANAVEDLTPEELHHLPHEHANSIGFDAWHVARTADNIVHFAFARERPLWVQQGLHEAWSLPRVEQGTGMPPEQARALRFPGAPLLAGYVRDVATAITPRIEAMTDDFLAEPMEIKFVGTLPRAAIVGRTLLQHGAAHLGQISLARTLLGHEGVGF